MWFVGVRQGRSVSASEVVGGARWPWNSAVERSSGSAMKPPRMNLTRDGSLQCWAYALDHFLRHPVSQGVLASGSARRDHKADKVIATNGRLWGLPACRS